MKSVSFPNTEYGRHIGFDFGSITFETAPTTQEDPFSKDYLQHIGISHISRAPWFCGPSLEFIVPILPVILSLDQVSTIT